MPSAPIPCRCGCSDEAGSAAHRIVAALAGDDIDAAMDAGLLEVNACDSCSPACRALLLDARDARRVALAARERFRAREARLVRRQQERAMPRDEATSQTAVAGTSLPPAAAAALARARAKAADTGNK